MLMALAILVSSHPKVVSSSKPRVMAKVRSSGAMNVDTRTHTTSNGVSRVMCISVTQAKVLLLLQLGVAMAMATLFSKVMSVAMATVVSSNSKVVNSSTVMSAAMATTVRSNPRVVSSRMWVVAI